MTALERAREAVQDATGLSARKAGDAVRATLAAIRAPTDGMEGACERAMSGYMDDDFADLWSAVIDHILNGAA